VREGWASGKSRSAKTHQVKGLKLWSKRFTPYSPGGKAILCELTASSHPDLTTPFYKLTPSVPPTARIQL
jgi:hypothetical protein